MKLPRTATPYLLLILSAALLASAWSLSQSINQQTAPSTPHVSETPPPEVATITEVIDGDEVKLDSGHRVRYIGVRTPTVSREIQCFGPEAIYANEQIVGQQIRLEPEPLLRKARDGAWVTYAWLIQGEMDEEDATTAESGAPTIDETADSEEEIADSKAIADHENEGTGAETQSEEAAGEAENSAEEEDPKDIFINERILEGGFGFPVVSEDMLHGQRLLAAARYASATGKGLWGKCELVDIPGGHKITKPHEECLIKGVARGDNKLYHTPECANYSDVTVLGSKGDHYFCSEDEAALAGFLPAPTCPTPTPEQ